jgi:hypothetical protein
MFRDAGYTATTENRLYHSSLSMDTRFVLPAELVGGTSIAGNEYGWPVALFSEAARRAEALGYACAGGQFQFRIPAGICEMYWLSAESSGRQLSETWRAYCERSRIEVLDRFSAIIEETDFIAEAVKWPLLKTEIERGLDLLSALVFVAYFESESEWLRDISAANAALS